MCCGAGPGPDILFTRQAGPGPQIVFAGRTRAHISGPCRALIYTGTHTYYGRGRKVAHRPATNRDRLSHAPAEIVAQDGVGRRKCIIILSLLKKPPL